MNSSPIFHLSSYFLNPYSFPSFLTAILALVFGFFIQNLEKTSSFNRTILYIYLSSALWLFGCCMLLNSRTAGIAFFWAHVLFIGLILSCATLFHFSVSMTDQWPRQKHSVYVFYVLAFLLMTFTRHPNFFEGMGEYFFGYYPRAGVGQLVLLFFIASCFLLSLFNILKQYMRVTEPSEKRHMGFFIVAFLVISFSFLDILSGYGMVVYPLGNMAVLGFVVGITCYKIKTYYTQTTRRTQEMEEEIASKTHEITKIVEELRTTQLKLLESGKVSALAALSAGILHQISQPITAIHGFVKFIKKEMPPNQPFYKPICLMEEQSVYLKEMLEDLMELIRHRSIKKENIDVNSSIQRAVNLLTDELRIRRVAWDLALTEDLPLVHADAVHLQQVFMNIIINGIQAMSDLPRGSNRSLKITSEFARQKNQVVVSFQDSGPGLSEETKEQIFEPFFSTKTSGSGIGLALCKDLIAEHGGTIEVDSQPGAGANFIICLPCSDSIVSKNLGVQRI